MARHFKTIFGALSILAAGLAGIASPAAAALDGNSYAAIAPTYNGGGGSTSFVRFFNPRTTATTFTVKVVGTPNATLYGTTTYQIAPNAEIQKPLSTILQDVAAGALRNGDTGFSVYLQDTDMGAGYQHVIYNGTTTLFENASNCRTILNDAMATVGNNAALIGVHTSALAGGLYPSAVVIHNTRPIYTTYKVTVIDAATGNVICKPNGPCSVNIATEANETLALDFKTNFETPLSWVPTSNQLHANLLITDASLNAMPSAVISQSIRNVALQGAIDMSNACSVNQISAATTAIAAAASTVFDGVIGGTGDQSGAITLTIQGSATASAAPLGNVETQAGVEKPQAVLNVTGALRLANATSTVTLAGTYNSTTNALSVAGGAFVFQGSVSNGSLNGTYTAGAVTGGFVTSKAVVPAIQGRTFCGHYSGNKGGSGTFNFVATQDNQVSGNYNPTTAGDTGGTVSGTINGTVFSAVASSGSVVTGTITTTAVAATYVDLDGGTGSLSGTVCGLPR